MSNKIFLLALCAMLVALCSSADAQQAQRLNKIGRLSAGSSTDPLSKASYDAFRGGMRDLGWFERKNLVYENRWVGDKPENARSLAAELAGLKVDVIVAVGRLSTGFQPSFRGEFMSRKTD